VTLSEADADRTAGLLTSTLGFRSVAEEGDRLRFDVGPGGPGATVDVLGTPGAGRGTVAAGSIHHVAWRAPDALTQLGWREEIVETGLEVTPVLDRQYFRSIYFREPGGVLFEIATDPPGFTIDEDPAHLGEQLRLPPWLESSREDLERALPPLTLPPPR